MFGRWPTDSVTELKQRCDSVRLLFIILVTERIVMTKKEFKELWESNDDGGGITFQDIADCAIEWGITTSPYMSNRHEIRYSVLLDAGVNDVEYYNPTQQ